MRKTALDMVHEFAKRDPRVVFIGSDLGSGTLNAFREEMPDRFFMEGVSEANVVGMAAGLAAEGRIVYVNTLAVFLTRRAYEQVALDVCMHNLDVRLVGNGGGLVYAPLGPTHMATDDLALMRALPNMTVIAPADAPEMRRLMLAVQDRPGPAYIRLGKGNEPPITPDVVDMKIGDVVPIREGSDALILTTGVTLHAAAPAAEALAREGCQTAILHCPVIKPLNAPAIAAAIRSVPLAVVVEEHVPAGGLGSAIAALIAEDDSLRGTRFRRIGLPDAFPDHYGSQADLMNYYGITPENIAATIRAARK